MKEIRLKNLFMASLGGLLAGFSLLSGYSLFMPFGLAFLWEVSLFPFACFCWGFFALLLSHIWLLSLHPLDWIGIPSHLSFPIVFLLWCSCGLIAGTLVFLWSLIFNLPFFENGRSMAFRRKFLHALFMSCLWGLAEVLLAKYSLFWIGIGASLLPQDRWLAGLAKIFGSGGLAAIQLLIAWWIWQSIKLFKNKLLFKKVFYVGFLLIFIFHLCGFYLLFEEEFNQEIKVGLWQTSIPIREKISYNKSDQFFEDIRKVLLLAKTEGASLLLAPEGTIGTNKELAFSTPIDFLSGGLRMKNGKQKSSLLFFPKGEKNNVNVLDKYRLVPIGEWIPSFLGSSFKGLSAIGGIEPGNPSRLLKWQGSPIAVAICYEISDGMAISKAVEEGAQWIFSLANLDPYPFSLQRQFLALAQLRSIESARDSVVVGNTGPTNFINSSGVIRSGLIPFEEGILIDSVRLRGSLSGYIIWGNKPLFISLLIGFLGSFKIRTKKSI